MEKGAATYAGTFRVSAKDDPTDPKAVVATPTTGAAAKADRELAPPNRLSGAFTFDSKRLSVDEFRFESGPLDDPYIADGKAFIELGAKPRFAVVADGAQVRFDEAGVQAASRQTLERRLAQLQETLADLPKPTIPGSVEINLPAIVTGDTTIREVKVSAEPRQNGWNIKSMAAVLPGRATVEATGFLDTETALGFKGRLLVAVAQPSGFMAWLSKDVDEAIRRLPAAGFSADVDLTAGRQVFSKLELQLGDARFNGEVRSQRPENARPSMLVRLDGGALDFDGLSAFASLFVSDSGANRFGDTDLDLAIKAGPVGIAGLTADTLDTAIRLREGRVEVDRMTVGGLAGATVSATASLKDFPVRPIGTVDASVVAVDLQPLIDLVAERFPQQALARALRERGAAHGGLYADSEINVVADSSLNGSGQVIYSLNAKGLAGGTEFSGSYLGAVGDPNSQIKVSFKGKNADATPLLALYGVTTLPLGLTGPGETSVSASGTLGGGLTTTMRFTGDAASAEFTGDVSAGEQGFAAKGKVGLMAADIEPWMMTAGLGLPGMGTGTGVDLKADADYGCWCCPISTARWRKVLWRATSMSR
jgi:hypothetical protein